MPRLLLQQLIHPVPPQKVILVSFGKMCWCWLRSLPRLVWHFLQCWVLLICMFYGYQACCLSGFGVSCWPYKLCLLFSRYCSTRCPQPGPPMGFIRQVRISTPFQSTLSSFSIYSLVHLWCIHLISMESNIFICFNTPSHAPSKAIFSILPTNPLSQQAKS